MTKKEMIERWNSEPEWIDKRKEIQNALVSPTGQQKYVKSDLRGLKNCMGRYAQSVDKRKDI